MATIYLDHNIVHFFALGFRSAAEEAKERAAFSQCRSPVHRFALSEWNLIEAANETSATASAACAAFIDSLPALWMFHGKYVQEQEMKRFLYAAPGMPGSPLDLGVVATEHYAQSFFLENPTPPFATCKMRPSEQINRLRSDPTMLAEINSAARETPQALLAGQRARAAGFITTLQPIVDRSYYAQLLPKLDAEGAPASDALQAAWLDRCCNDTGSLFAAAPTIAAEDALTKVRLMDPNRKPTSQDAYDLQHVLVPLVYCDAIVTDDKYLLATCNGATKRLARAAQVFRSLSDAVTSLAPA